MDNSEYKNLYFYLRFLSYFCMDVYATNTGPYEKTVVMIYDTYL